MKILASTPLVKLLFLVVMIPLGLCQFSCGERNGISYAQRQLIEPAENAEEWQTRLELDLKTYSFSDNLLGNLYAELPPKDQWPSLCTFIDELTADQARFKKLSSQTFYSPSDRESMRKKLIFFSALLKNGEADHEPALRELMSTHEISEYEREETVHALMSVSKDHVATLAWIKASNPELLTPRDNDSSYQSQEDSAWEKALAENRVEDGIALLKAEIKKQDDPSENTQHFNTLLRLGLVLDRKDLAKEASEGLMAALLDAIENDDSTSSYSYQDIFDMQALEGDWQGIIDDFTGITDAYAQAGTKPSNHDLGKLDNAEATYLTALHKLNRTAEFLTLLKEIQMESTQQPNEFFDLLDESAKGQAPLGVLYVNSLVFAGQREEALAFALHLLAREPGKDAFYECLINLDEARATEFITALRIYDPYEERPLIWLADIIRRAGDLELALKTIEEAIALDPSDGDHGKDTRMFCYEVLAHIHADAGRKEKAELYRSVVDSIRQGEAADDFLHAGLIKEATDRYKIALGQFEDAYCLQSRLAMTLAKNGQFEEAVVHFEKAFSLMPVSFGPRESHCFGCEGLFSDKRVIDIALPLLEAIEKENPGNPRTPYLLGLMLSEKNEEAQASLAYRRALKLDPSYFNAASQLLNILSKEPKNFAEAKELRKQMFEIAPYPEKPKYIQNASHLPAYWQMSEEFPPSPLNLPKIPFTPTAELKKQQYLEFDEFDSYFHNIRLNDSSQALDGWSANELRRANTFLEFLDNLD